ncbi:MAG: RNA recognition motif domain-containing protein [Vulcanimicrobiota bacterium]
MNLYVGNLSFEVTEDELLRAFEEFGSVTSVNVVKDRDTGQARGFGFVEMGDKTAGNKAIEGMNDKEFGGRRLVVNEARAKKTRR